MMIGGIPVTGPSIFTKRTSLFSPGRLQLLGADEQPRARQGGGPNRRAERSRQRQRGGGAGCQLLHRLIQWIA